MSIKEILINKRVDLEVKEKLEEISVILNLMEIEIDYEYDDKKLVYKFGFNLGRFYYCLNIAFSFFNREELNYIKLDIINPYVVGSFMTISSYKRGNNFLTPLVWLKNILVNG